VVELRQRRGCDQVGFDGGGAAAANLGPDGIEGGAHGSDGLEAAEALDRDAGRAGLEHVVDGRNTAQERIDRHPDLL